MFQNTSTMSLLFYAVFVAIAFAGLIYVLKAVKRGVDPAKLDRVIELFKWTIGSVAIATVSLVVGDHFKERDQDVDELNYFHTYVEDVKKTEGVNERLRLVTYLSTVAPVGPLKQAWLNYRDTVNKELVSLMAVEKALKPLEAKDSTGILTPGQMQQKDSLEKKREELNRPISLSDAAAVPNQYRIVLSTDETGTAAMDELEKAKEINPNAEIIEKDGRFLTIINEPSHDKAKLTLLEAQKRFNTNPFIVRREFE